MLVCLRSPRSPLRHLCAVTFASEIASLAGVLNTASAQLVEVVAAAIAAGVTDEAGMKTPAAWLAWRSGLSPERAGQIVKLARVRDRYPLLFAAFGRGEVSVDQMTELVKAPEWAEQQMLGFAEIGTVQRLRRTTDGWRIPPITRPTDPVRLRPRTRLGTQRGPVLRRPHPTHRPRPHPPHHQTPRPRLPRARLHRGAEGSCRSTTSCTGEAAAPPTPPT